MMAKGWTSVLGKNWLMNIFMARKVRYIDQVKSRSGLEISMIAVEVPERKERERPMSRLTQGIIKDSLHVMGHWNLVESFLCRSLRERWPGRTCYIIHEEWDEHIHVIKIIIITFTFNFIFFSFHFSFIPFFASLCQIRLSLSSYFGPTMCLCVHQSRTRALFQDHRVWMQNNRNQLRITT